MDTQKLDDVFGVKALLVVLARRTAQAQHLLDPTTAALEVAAGQHVVEHAHALEQRDVLKGPRNTALGGLVRAHAPPGLSGIGDAAALGLVDAIDHVEQRTFARAVGADQCTDFPGLHGEADGGDGLDALERQGDSP